MALISIPFSTDLYRNLIIEKTDIKDFLHFLLYKDNTTDTFPIIERILREYHFNDGGSPYIEGFEITAAEYNVESNKGRVWFKYRIDYYFGCEDRSAGTTFNESYNFEMDTEGFLLKINFPEPVQRDTLDEF
ncbi:MAG: hypothetical protein EOP46_05890 [Sphingobacteriaceae bacterium]|nr:MAG: hypothetical protein EOP46_05890 [Sphingobacteriaceae bacterium]